MKKHRKIQSPKLQPQTWYVIYISQPNIHLGPYTHKRAQKVAVENATSYMTCTHEIYEEIKNGEGEGKYYHITTSPSLVKAEMELKRYGSLPNRDRDDFLETL